MTATAHNHLALSGDGSNLPSRITYRPHEEKAVRAQKRRLARLESRRPEWLTPPANDNQAWPLAQQLRKEGNDVLLRVAERYRAIYDAATADVQLMGTSLAGDDLYNLDERSYAKDDGTIETRGVRRSLAKRDKIEWETGADESKKPVTFKPKNPSPTRNAWNGDAMINAAIDSRRMLYDMQKALGPLLEPFENAVLHGETLSAIGEAKGGNTVSSGPIGRAYVMDGLQMVRVFLTEADRAGLG